MTLDRRATDTCVGHDFLQGLVTTSATDTCAGHDLQQAWSHGFRKTRGSLDNVVVQEHRAANGKELEARSGKT